MIADELGGDDGIVREKQQAIAVVSAAIVIPHGYIGIVYAFVYSSCPINRGARPPFNVIESNNFTPFTAVASGDAYLDGPVVAVPDVFAFSGAKLGKIGGVVGIILVLNVLIFKVMGVLAVAFGKFGPVMVRVNFVVNFRTVMCVLPIVQITGNLVPAKTAQRIQLQRAGNPGYRGAFW